MLSQFRARLVAGDAAERLLGSMLERLRERGLLVRGGRQRTDATHVLAAVRELNRLELVTQTLRAALEALATAAPTWLEGIAAKQWYQRYGQRARDWRLPRPRPPGPSWPSPSALMVGAGGGRLHRRRAAVAAGGPGGAGVDPVL